MLGFLFFWDYRNWWIGVAKQDGETKFYIFSLLMFAVVVSPTSAFIVQEQEGE